MNKWAVLKREDRKSDENGDGDGGGERIENLELKIENLGEEESGN